MPSREFRMILPKYDNEGHRIDTDVLRDFSKQVAAEFGGVSVIPTILGCFPDDDGELQCEENMVIQAVVVDTTIDDINEKRLFLNQLAKRSGGTLGQEAIMLQEETDTVTTFVAGKRANRVAPSLIEGDFFKRLMD